MLSTSYEKEILIDVLIFAIYSSLIFVKAQKVVCPARSTGYDK